MTDPRRPDDRVQRAVDDLRVPEDAGEYAAGLERILRRIPDGWGRWIGCGPGWYRLLVELDTQLAALDPDYRVQQVKEKFGTLRYYCSLAPMPLPACCLAEEAAHPRPRLDHPDALSRWQESQQAHRATAEHIAAWDTLKREYTPQSAEVAKQMAALVAHYERLSSRTCETCGEPGKRSAERGWHRVRCAACRTAGR